MKAQELREVSLTELQARLNDEIEVLSDLRFNKAIAGQIENPARIKNTKREIARLKTIIKENLRDRKSTRLNSSHVAISYAVFCLKKKKKKKQKHNVYT